jgi:tetratricopeptide (TPR) repeat protein
MTPRLEQLLARAAESVDMHEVIGCLRAAAELCEGELHDLVRAQELHLRVLDIDPMDSASLSALARIYRASERWSELVGVLARQADLTADWRERAELGRAAAQVFLVHLGDAEAALERYREVLVFDPSDGASVAAFESLCDRDDSVALRAAELLEPIFSAAGAFDKAARVLEIQLRHTADAEARARLEARLALVRDTLA